MFRSDNELNSQSVIPRIIPRVVISPVISRVITTKTPLGQTSAALSTLLSMQAHSAKIVTLNEGTFDIISEETIDLEYVEKGDIVKVRDIYRECVFYQDIQRDCFFTKLAIFLPNKHFRKITSRSTV